MSLMRHLTIFSRSRDPGKWISRFPRTCFCRSRFSCHNVTASIMTAAVAWTMKQRKLARPCTVCERGRCSDLFTSTDEGLLPSHTLTSPTVRPTFNGRHSVSITACTALDNVCSMLSADCLWYRPSTSPH